MLPIVVVPPITGASTGGAIACDHHERVTFSAVTVLRASNGDPPT